MSKPPFDSNYLYMVAEAAQVALESWLRRTGAPDAVIELPRMMNNPQYFTTLSRDAFPDNPRDEWDIPLAEYAAKALVGVEAAGGSFSFS